MVVWCKDYMEKETTIKSWRSLRLILPLESLETNGYWFMVFIRSFVSWVFCDFFELDLWVLIVSIARPCQFVCGAMLLLVFHGFLLVCFFFLNLCFEGIGNWLGRMKLMELGKSWLKPNRWCKSWMKIGACIRAVEGKSMAASWIGWVHWCKWTMVG